MRFSIQIEFDKTLDLNTRKKNTVVGRAPESDLVVSDSAISRSHCQIESVGSQFYLTDLNSHNGVFIDSVRLEPNRRTLYDPSLPLMLGTFNCELSLDEEVPGEHKVLKTSSDSNATATIRLARLDLNKPSVSLELEKKAKPKARNPVTDHDDHEVEVKTSLPWTYILLGLAIALIFLARFYKVF